MRKIALGGGVVECFVVVIGVVEKEQRDKYYRFCMFCALTKPAVCTLYSAKYILMTLMHFFLWWSAVFKKVLHSVIV